MSLIIGFIATFAIGCGSSNDDFVFTGTGGGQQQAGSLTYNFLRLQGTINVPTATTQLRFEFFRNNGEVSRPAVTVNFDTQVTINDVPTDTVRTRVTALAPGGIPLQQTDTNVVVNPGQNTVVDGNASTTIAINIDALTASPANANILVGGTQSYTASASFSNGDTVGVSDNIGLGWASSNQNIATITPGGVATGVSNGTTNITATFLGATSPAATLTVGNVIPPDPTLTSIAITSATFNGNAVGPNNVTIPVNGMVSYSATGTFSDNSSRPLTGADGIVWETSNPATATVAGNTYTGVSNGTTQVTATVGTLSTPAVTLTVSQAPVRVGTQIVGPAGNVRPTNSTATFTARATFSDGSFQPLTQGVTFTVVSQTPAGTLAPANNTTGVFTTGPVNGTANVTATESGFTSTPVTLTVSDSAMPTLQSITVTGPGGSTNATVAVNGTVQLTATGNFDFGPPQTINATWVSQAPATATVNATTGLVTGVTNGTANITATSGTVTSAPFAVTVTNPAPPVSTFTLNTGAAITLPSGLSAATGFNVVLTNSTSGQVIMPGAMAGQYTTQTDNNTIASVDQTNGRIITGATVGTTNIRFLVGGNVVANVNVTNVAATIQALTVTPAAFTMAVGDSRAVTASVTYSNGTIQPNAQFFATLTTTAPAGVAYNSATGRLVGTAVTATTALTFRLPTTGGVAPIPANVDSMGNTVTVTAAALTSYTVRVAGIQSGTELGKLPQGFRAIVEVDGVFGTDPATQITRPLIPNTEFTLATGNAAFPVNNTAGNGNADGAYVTSNNAMGTATLTVTPNATTFPGSMPTLIPLTGHAPTLAAMNPVTVSFEKSPTNTALLRSGTTGDANEFSALRNVEVRANFATVTGFRVANANVTVTGTNVGAQFSKYPDTTAAAPTAGTNTTADSLGTTLGWTALGVSAANATPPVANIQVGAQIVNLPISIFTGSDSALALNVVVSPATTLPIAVGQSVTLRSVLVIGGVQSDVTAIYPPNVIFGATGIQTSRNADGSLRVTRIGATTGNVRALDNANRLSNVVARLVQAPFDLTTLD